MGYYLHITRAGDSWADSADHPISTEEWTAFAAAHPSIVADPDNGPLDHVFTCHDGTEACLTWKNGQIEVRGTHADDKDLARLAAQIEARLLGDDDEEYDLNGQPIEWEAPRPPITPNRLKI